MHRYFHILLIASSALCATPISLVAAAPEKEKPAAHPEVGIPYQVVFKGIDDPRILDDFKATSSLTAPHAQPPLSFSSLQRRAEDDLEHFTQIMKSYGYYSSHINVIYEREPAPTKVIFVVYAGPVYK